MRNQEWCIQDRAGRMGPYSLKELRNLAESGLLNSKMLVTRDEVRWVAADRVSMLFREEGAGAQIGKLMVESDDGATSELSKPLAWPIIRIRQRGYGAREVVVIQPGGISIGKIGKASDPESFGNPARWTNDRTLAHFSAEEIKSITIHRAGYLSSTTWWNRFTMIGDNGARRRFRVPARETPNVAAALREIVGDRFRLKPTRGLAVSDWVILFFVVLGLMLLMGGN